MAFSSQFVTMSYKNEVGIEVSFNFFTTFVILKCEEQHQNAVHGVKQSATHGNFYTGMSMDERHIRLEGVVRHGLTDEHAIEALQLAFNPTLPGTLVYENRRINERKEIACRLEELPRVYWSRNRLVFEIKLIALDPFWKGLPLIQHISQLVKMFKFKLAIPQKGMSFGLYHRLLESKFNNAGNVESGFTAVLRATGGTVLNFSPYKSGRTA